MYICTLRLIGCNSLKYNEYELPVDRNTTLCSDLRLLNDTMISQKTMIEATIKYFYRQEGIISDSSQLVVKSEVGFGLTLI